MGKYTIPTTYDKTADEVIAEFPDEVARLGDGEGRLIGFLVGQVMRRSGGKADPRRVNELLRERLG